LLNNIFRKSQLLNRQGEPVLVFRKPRWVPEEHNPKMACKEPDQKKKRLADPANCAGNRKGLRN